MYDLRYDEDDRHFEDLTRDIIIKLSEEYGFQEIDSMSSKMDTNINFRESSHLKHQNLVFQILVTHLLRIFWSEYFLLSVSL